MTETIAYIKESLRDLYPSSEVSSLVRLIMERVCNIQPHHFLFCKDKELPESEKSRIHDIVERLKQMEPIQYILGTADFYSLQFEVDPSVLIPRPETEELVEQVILDNADQKIKILDIGTGSGCIAVTLRKHLKKASVIATDISAEALATARRNAKRNNTTVTFIQTDILDPEKAEMDIPFILDVIVSNPPYIKEEEKKDMERNVLDYEPHLALFVPDAYCSASERCIQDVEKKIKAAGLAGEESDRIVSRLLQERFIDESRFARYFVNDKLRFNKWGRVKINYEMQRKGIPSSIRSEALEGIDEQEYRSILLSLLKSKKKVTRGKDDREVYAKLLRFAAGRGFETRETSRCLKQLFNGNDYEDDFE